MRGAVLANRGAADPVRLRARDGGTADGGALDAHGRFQGYTFRDLTDDIPGICAHWEREGLDFSAVYTGYLASARQIALVRDVIRSRLRPGGVLIVDPAMADDGRLYSGFGTDVVDAMRTLCAEADYILPNVTEAALLAGCRTRAGRQRI